MLFASCAQFSVKEATSKKLVTFLSFHFSLNAFNVLRSRVIELTRSHLKAQNTILHKFSLHYGVFTACQDSPPVRRISHTWSSHTGSRSHSYGWGWWRRALYRTYPPWPVRCTACTLCQTTTLTASPALLRSSRKVCQAGIKTADALGWSRSWQAPLQIVESIASAYLILICKLLRINASAKRINVNANANSFELDAVNWSKDRLNQKIIQMLNTEKVDCHPQHVILNICLIF